MARPRKPVSRCIADDDSADRLMAGKALGKIRLRDGLYLEEDGEELPDYPHDRGRFRVAIGYSPLGLIPLDLDTPRKVGHEKDAEIKAGLALHSISVAVRTTSQAAQQIRRCCDLSVDSCRTNPVSFRGLPDAVQVLNSHCRLVRWLSRVQGV